MSRSLEFDQRLGDWLEEGPQTVPDWLVDQALDMAHGTAQLRPRPRLRWLRERPVQVARPMSAAIGAFTGLVVVAAFVLGVLTGPRVADQPTPAPSGTASPPPASVVPRPVTSLDFIDVLPGESPDFASLVGLAATTGPDAVWTAVVTGGGARLVRIDAATGVAVSITIPDADGILSPPVAAGDLVWTSSAAGLHAVPANGSGPTRTISTSFAPAEIGVSSEGLWVARAGGASLIDPATGRVLREIAAAPGTLPGRIIGAPALGSLWACLSQTRLGRLDATTGALSATLDLPADGDCHGRVFAVTGVAGIPDGVIPLLASAVVDPGSTTVLKQFAVGPWSDVVIAEGRLWFLRLLRDDPGSTLALVALDPDSGGPASITTFDGDLYLNSAYESGYLSIAGDYLWVLANPSPGPQGGGGPQIIRIPMSAVR